MMMDDGFNEPMNVESGWMITRHFKDCLISLSFVYACPQQVPVHSGLLITLTLSPFLVQ